MDLRTTTDFSFEGDFLDHIMHEDDIFSNMIEPTFYAELDTTPPPHSPPHSPHSLQQGQSTTGNKLPERRLSVPKRQVPPANSDSNRKTNRQPEKRDLGQRETDFESTRTLTRGHSHESITSRLGPNNSQRRTSKSPPPLKRQALNPRKPSQRTAQLNAREYSPSSGHSRSSTCTKERLSRSSRSPALRSRSRSRSPPRGPSAYRSTADRRGDSTNRHSLRNPPSSPRRPLPPQNEARTDQFHEANKESQRTLKSSPGESPVQKVQYTSGFAQTQRRSRLPLPDFAKIQQRSSNSDESQFAQSQQDFGKNQPNLAKNTSSSSYINPSRDQSPSPPRAPAALRKYTLHHSPRPNLSPAQVARAAKAAAEASRFRNLQKIEQNQHRPPSSSLSRPHAVSSSSHRAIPRSPEITLMDDSKPPPTAPAADLRKGKQKQPLPPPYVSGTGDKRRNVSAGRTGPSLTNRNHSSSRGSLTPSKMGDETSGPRKAEDEDRSAEDVERKVANGSNDDDRRQEDVDPLAPPSKPAKTNGLLSLAKKSDLPQNTTAAEYHPPITNPKKSLPKRYGPNGSIHSANYWFGNATPPTTQNFDHYDMQRQMQAFPNHSALMNSNQMMIPNIGMTMNMLHSSSVNPNMAMIGSNMIPFLQSANSMHGSARLNYVNQGINAVDMNMGMGDAGHGYGMEYQGLDLAGMQAGMGMPVPYELRSRMMDVGMDGMGTKESSAWERSKNEGMYDERYNSVSSGVGNNAEVNPGIMGMSDASEYHGNGAQNPWFYSPSSIPDLDFCTDYGIGVPTSNAAIRAANRSQTFNVTSTPTTHDSDAQSVTSNATSVANGREEVLVSDTSSAKSHRNTSSTNSYRDAAGGRKPKPKRRGPHSYNNHNIPLIRFVGTPPPAFPLPNFHPGQLPPPPTQFLNPGFFG